MEILFSRESEQLAVVESDRGFSYKQLAMLIDKKRHWLSSHCHAQERVLFLKRNSIELIADYLACAESSFVVILADYQIREEIIHIITECSPKLICIDAEDLQDRTEILDRHGIKHCIHKEGEDIWLEISTEFVSNHVLDKACLIQYTSGSTGLSRGAVHSLETFEYMKYEFAQRVGVRPGEKYIGTISLCHGYGFTCTLITCLSNGGTLYLVDGKNIPGILKCIEEKRIDYLFSVPPIFKGLIRYLGIRRYDLSSLKFCCSSAMKLEQSVAEEFKERCGKFLNQEYGSAETSVISVTNYADDNYKTSNQGKCVDSVKVSVAPDGEILVDSKSMAIGYADGTSLLGTYHMGDIGEINADGTISIMGRKKRLVDVGGKKFFLDELEHSLCGCKEVEQSFFDLENGIIVAYIKLRADADMLAVENYCKQTLAPYKCPKRFIKIDKMICSSIGKIKLENLRHEIT